MRMPSGVRPLLVVATLSSACPATVDGTAADGGFDVLSDAGVVTPVDVPPRADVPAASPDAPRGPCRWRAGEAVVLPAVTSAAPHRTLLDVRSAEGGAWALTADDAGGDRLPDVALERLDSSGHRRVDGAVRFPEGPGVSDASLAVDEALGRRAVLWEARNMSAGTCGLTLLDARGAPSPRRTITFPTGGFSLGGCRDLLANGSGYTFLAEQIRALWGASMVQLDAAGQVDAQRAPPVLDGFPPVPFGRFGLSDRSFVLASKETLGPTPRMTRLLVRRYDEQGMSRVDTSAAAQTLGVLRDFVVTGAGDGLLALWEEASDATTPTYGVVVRALDADGRPRGEARPLASLGFYQGGLAAAFAQGDVLVAGVAGSGVLRPVVAPLGPDGAARGDVIPIPLPTDTSGVERVRIVATPAGAIVVYTTDPARYPNRLVAVPLTCER